MAQPTMEEMVQMLKYQGEQVTKLTEALASVAQGGWFGGGGSRAWDSPDKYKNIKTFTGEQKDWEEFSLKVRSQVAAGEAKVVDLMDTVVLEMQEKDVEEGDWAFAADETYDEDRVKQISSKLYNVMMNLTTGEANAVVRRCRGNGLWAWRKLSTQLNPRTLASGVKAISQVLNPPKITNSTKADTAIDAWEEKMVKLNVEYGEELSSKMKVAVMYSILPKDLQEKVLDKCAVSWDGAREVEAAVVFEKVREEVKNIAKSRRDMVTPKPMEVDRIQAEGGWWNTGAYCEYCKEEEEEPEHVVHEIDFVGKGSKGIGKGMFKGECWTCGAPGHRSFECPAGIKGKGHVKGVGKGEGGGHGKGAPYPSYQKGDFKGGKGTGGKGTWAATTTRACFNCGSTTHLMRDCPGRAALKVQEVSAEEESEVLFIGHTTAIDVEERWETVKKKTKNDTDELACWAPPGLQEMAASRKAKEGWRKKHCGFRVLMEDEDSDGDDDEAEECYVQAVVDDSRDVDMERKKFGEKWANLGVGEITIDSAADESCWPQEQGGAFETKPAKKKIQLRTANGGEMRHYGEKEITFTSGGEPEVIGLRFQVTDVKKPLLAVRRLVEKGNIVSFGPEAGHNYILNEKTGKRIPMEKRGGGFVIKVNFIKELSGFTRPGR